MSAVPTGADTLTCFPFRDAAADRIDASRDFMTRHTRILKPWPQTIFDERIAVANAAGLDSYPNLSIAGLRDFAFNYFKWPIGPSNLCDAHLCHSSFHARAG